MKKVLLLALLFSSIPFNASCIAEIHYKVTITGGDHCSWDTPVPDATRNRDYFIKFTLEPGYILYKDKDVFQVFIGTLDMVDFVELNENTGDVKIPAQYVTHDITIIANAQEKSEL